MQDPGHQTIPIPGGLLVLFLKKVPKSFGGQKLALQFFVSLLLFTTLRQYVLSDSRFRVARKVLHFVFCTLYLVLM